MSNIDTFLGISDIYDLPSSHNPYIKYFVLRRRDYQISKYPHSKIVCTFCYDCLNYIKGKVTYNFSSGNCDYRFVLTKENLFSQNTQKNRVCFTCSKRLHGWMTSFYFCKKCQTTKLEFCSERCNDLGKEKHANECGNVVKEKFITKYIHSKDWRKKNYYELLGVKKDDPTEVIKKKHRRLIIKYHPDRSKNEIDRDARAEISATLNEARDTLMNVGKRLKYNKSLEKKKKNGPKDDFKWNMNGQKILQKKKKIENERYESFVEKKKKKLGMKEIVERKFFFVVKKSKGSVMDENELDEMVRKSEMKNVSLMKREKERRDELRRVKREIKRGGMRRKLEKNERKSKELKNVFERMNENVNKLNAKMHLVALNVMKKELLRIGGVFEDDEKNKSFEKKMISLLEKFQDVLKTNFLTPKRKFDKENVILSVEKLKSTVEGVFNSKNRTFFSSSIFLSSLLLEISKFNIFLKEFKSSKEYIDQSIMLNNKNVDSKVVKLYVDYLTQRQANNAISNVNNFISKCKLFPTEEKTWYYYMMQSKALFAKKLYERAKEKCEKAISLCKDKRVNKYLYRKRLYILGFSSNPEEASENVMIQANTLGQYRIDLDLVRLMESLNNIVRNNKKCIGYLHLMKAFYFSKIDVLKSLDYALLACRSCTTHVQKTGISNLFILLSNRREEILHKQEGERNHDVVFLENLFNLKEPGQFSFTFKNKFTVFFHKIFLWSGKLDAQETQELQDDDHEAIIEVKKVCYGLCENLSNDLDLLRRSFNLAFEYDFKEVYNSILTRFVRLKRIFPLLEVRNVILKAIKEKSLNEFVIHLISFYNENKKKLGLSVKHLSAFEINILKHVHTMTEISVTRKIDELEKFTVNPFSKSVEAEKFDAIIWSRIEKNVNFFFESNSDESIINFQRKGCHKEILALRSLYFRDMFYGSSNESKERRSYKLNFEKNALLEILKFFYLNFKTLTFEKMDNLSLERLMNYSEQFKLKKLLWKVKMEILKRKMYKLSVV